MEMNMDKGSGSAKKAAPTATERKRKVVVIMDVPDGPLLYCRLEDLTLTPERGSSYVLNGRLFDVERVIETLSVNPRCSRKSTDEQLIALLQMLSGDNNAMVRLASMRNIGTEEETGIAGGIILATSLSFTDGADRLLYLKLRPVNLSSPGDSMRQLARQAMEAGSANGGGTDKKDAAGASETPAE